MSWKRVLLIGTLIAIGLAGPIAILITNLDKIRVDGYYPQAVILDDVVIIDARLGQTTCIPQIERRGDGNLVISCKAPSTVDSELAKLVAGSAAFDAPDHATIGKTRVVEARLSVSELS